VDGFSNSLEPDLEKKLQPHPHRSSATVKQIESLIPISQRPYYADAGNARELRVVKCIERFKAILKRESLGHTKYFEQAGVEISNGL
jgi:hypothetical protein